MLGWGGRKQGKYKPEQSRRNFIDSYLIICIFSSSFSFVKWDFQLELAENSSLAFERKSESQVSEEMDKKKKERCSSDLDSSVKKRKSVVGGKLSERKWVTSQDKPFLQLKRNPHRERFPSCSVHFKLFQRDIYLMGRLSYPPPHTLSGAIQRGP